MSNEHITGWLLAEKKRWERLQRERQQRVNREIDYIKKARTELEGLRYLLAEANDILLHIESSLSGVPEPW